MDAVVSFLTACIASMMIGFLIGRHNGWMQCAKYLSDKYDMKPRQ